jgi:hypothetical protein
VPVAEESFVLLNQDLSRVLSEAGFREVPGKSLSRTFAGCTNPDSNCLKGIQGLATHLVARAQSDADGKVRFDGVAPGVYYVMAIAVDYGPKAFIWSTRVELKAGENALVLTPQNSIP